MSVSKVLISIVLAASLSGCATLFGDGQQLINVRTSNSKSVEGQLSNGTPFNVPGTVAFNKDGSQPVRVITNSEGCSPVTTVNREVVGLFWLNLFTFGLWPLTSGTDYISGDMWEYDTNVIVACSN